MNSDPYSPTDTLESSSSAVPKTNQKLYLNRREKLEKKHESELMRCKAYFDEFLDRFKTTNSTNLNFNKILEAVKVPFSTLPSMCQIKAFFQNYISRERRRKYMKKGLWNEKELKLLLWALMLYSDHQGRKIDDLLDDDWHQISQLFPSTDALKCKAKWFSIKKSKFMRAKWTQEEDSQLFSMMQKIQEKSKISWNELATNINNSLYNGEFMRTGRHCRDRWVHHLNPKLSRVQWSIEEDLKIVRYVIENGKKWANLAKTMENRNEDSIRNRFIKLMKGCRSKDKTTRNTKETRTESSMLSKLLNELSKKNFSEDEKSEFLGRKRRREHLFQIPQTVKEEEQFSNKDNIKLEPENKSQASFLRKQQKIEETPTQKTSLLNKSFDKSLTGEPKLPEKSIEAMVPGSSNSNQMNLFNEFWEQFTLQNQLLYQEMMLQRMRFMMGNLAWNNALNTTNNNK